ncbi:hypothetical protein Csp2054_11010 [Curtobacterium sp. 'Ferrero']|nr:hypothetical protein Csp2054_11010 [Curtobacterium sp. 'Ferrero']
MAALCVAARGLAPVGRTTGSLATVTDARDRPDGADQLLPLDVVSVGDRSIVPDLHRPVAAVVRDGGVERWLTWPSAPLPEGAVDEAEAWPTDDGVWVVYRSDGIDDVTRTAVHLDPDRVGAAVDLGDRRVVAADPGGLWLADPRDASAWMATIDGDEDGDDTDDVEDLDPVDPSDLPWAEADPFWPDPADWTEPDDDDEDDEDPDGLDEGRAPEDDMHDTHDTDDPGDTGSTVMTAYQWSIGFSDDPEADDPRSAPPADPGPPSPTPPTDLVRITPDGTRTTIRVDHLVEDVTIEGDRMTLRFHRTGPDRLPDAYGSWDVVYRPREVVVDVSGGLPETIATDAFDSVPVEEPVEYDADAADDERERASEELEARRGPFVGRLDLDGVAGSRWNRRELDVAARERATAELVDEFTHLADPLVGWSRGVDGPRRFRSDYRDVDVEVEGEWPATEVVVSFEHSAVPFLRLRRRYRVFDDTGRPVDHGYVTVYLEEDVATRHIRPRSAAVDGVLDI